MHGKINSNFRSYTKPNQFIIIKKTTSVSNKLNNSPMVSDKGKKNAGILSDFNKPAELTMLPTVWPVTLEKKNHNIKPEVTNKT